MCRGEAGTGAEDEVVEGVVQAVVPGRRAAHREAAQHFRGVAHERLVAASEHVGDVGLAGPAVGVAAATVDFERREVLPRLRLRRLGLGLGQEFHLGQRRVAAVQHDVERPRDEGVALVQLDYVRLDAPVHGRGVATDDRLVADLPPVERGHPRLGRALQTGVEDDEGLLDRVLRQELVEP